MPFLKLKQPKIYKQKERIKLNCKELINVAVSIGFLMLESGAEVYRVENSIYRICKAYGAKNVDAYAIPNLIVVTVSIDGEEFQTISKRIFPSETDLGKVDRLNDLSRYICANTPKYYEVKGKIQEIENAKHYSLFLSYVMHFLGAGIFSLFFQGNWQDALVAGFIGLIIKFQLDFLLKLDTNTVFINIICSFTSTSLAVLAVNLGIGAQTDKIIIGTIMLLVPGIILTKAMRDFITGDLMAGVQQLIEAVLVAIGIAIGVMFALYLFGVNESIIQV